MYKVTEWALVESRMAILCLSCMICCSDLGTRYNWLRQKTIHNLLFAKPYPLTQDLVVGERLMVEQQKKEQE
jgi:hypothetical protein